MKQGIIVVEKRVNLVWNWLQQTFPLITNTKAIEMQHEITEHQQLLDEYRNNTIKLQNEIKILSTKHQGIINNMMHIDRTHESYTKHLNDERNIVNEIKKVEIDLENSRNSENTKLSELKYSISKYYQLDQHNRDQLRLLSYIWGCIWIIGYGYITYIYYKKNKKKFNPSMNNTHISEIIHQNQNMYIQEMKASMDAHNEQLNHIMNIQQQQYLTELKEQQTQYFTQLTGIKKSIHINSSKLNEIEAKMDDINLSKPSIHSSSLNTAINAAGVALLGNGLIFPKILSDLFGSSIPYVQ